MNYDIYWIQIPGKLRYNSAKEAIKMNGIVTDITQKKQIQPKFSNFRQLERQNLAQSFKELKKIINLLPWYIYVTNIHDKTISLINLKLAKSLGLPNPELVKGKKITECFAPDYTRQIIWQQKQVLIYQQELHVQEEVTLADGIHYFDTTIAPLRDDSGKIYASLHTSSDIPDLAATKEALSQRTLQLEAANRELESFSYSVSHDLQAPLRAINGFSQILWQNYQSYLDARARHYIQRIQANSERMSNLIDALLQLSRVTRSQMKSVQVNLSKIAGDLAEELQAREPERKVEFIIAPNLQVKGDPQLLTIVLSNLFNNAWKYTSKRSHGKIEFNIMEGIDEQPTYLVRDNGAGFDPEYADKLFSAFQRLHSQTEFPGTGIGLATVQRIIYRHGGKVWAKGECDRGATVYFCLS
ncbi:MAG: ATP-binding protein [Pleurocapsa sp. MO_226.B13]|nr:ATP-binding protein [Pleurocapsa sp. MO_226.B13]